MGNEASKNKTRRDQNGDWFKYFTGLGVDIGCGNDPVKKDHCDRWDKPDGDAQYMQGVLDNMYHWVHSSHCLEHMREPNVALRHWYRVVKPGGYLIITVPSWELYEHKTWPSRFNPDHKWAFTLDPREMSGHVLYVPSFISIAMKHPEQLEYSLQRIQVNDHKYNYEMEKGRDQTQMGAQAEIEFIIKKGGNSQ